MKKYNRKAVQALLRFAEENDGPWNNEENWQDEDGEMITTDDLNLICATPALFELLSDSHRYWEKKYKGRKYKNRQEWEKKTRMALKNAKGELGGAER